MKPASPGDYHTPDWEETPEGLDRLMEELFRLTPPTAILCLAAHTAYGVQAWLKARGLRIPQDLSLVSLWDDVACGWISPGLRIACPSDSGSARSNRRIRSWVRGVAMDKVDKIQTLIPLQLNDGNSIGPANME